MKFYLILHCILYTRSYNNLLIMDPGGLNVSPDRPEIRFERFLLLYFKIAAMDISVIKTVG